MNTAELIQMDRLNIDDFHEALETGKKLNDEEISEIAQSCINDNTYLSISVVYDIRLLNWLLPRDPIKETLQSMIARCIERDLPDALDLIMQRIDHAEYPQRHIYLRWIRSLPCYFTARYYGWYDPEWEKRIIAIQRIWRSRRIGKVYRRPKHQYEGPDLDRAERENKYFGWRHSHYWVRWNPQKRYLLYKQFMRYDRVGDCAWQAYITRLGEDGADMPDPHHKTYGKHIAYREARDIITLVRNAK